MDDVSVPRVDLTGLVRQTIEQLRTKLLDLSLSNRLLNFKPSEKSKTHILIIDEIPERLFAKLENGKELEFAWIEEPDGEPIEERTPEFIEAFKQAKTTDAAHLEQLEKLGKRPSRRQISNLDRALRDRVRLLRGLSPRFKPSLPERARELGIDPTYDLPSEVLAQPGTRTELKVQTLLYRENMEAKLAAIRESDKTLLDDAGVNALYAAFGAVEWYESSDSDLPIYAPIIFAPVEIRRVLERGIYRYVLASRDDDIETNQAFGELIKATHGLELPPWNPDGTLLQYFEQMEQLLQSQRRWRLRGWVTVGLFTFSKMAMYRDLDAKRWSGRGSLDSHPILNDLLAGTEAISEVTLAPDYEIDSPSIANKNHTLVTDADSSQHSALIDVLEGKNLVVQGPPGTGKSQTITNIIAAAMNEGKRILFVAEKMAALKVVKDRLDSFGLGQFCLEVHSNKSRKAVVLKSFEERLNLSLLPMEGRQLREAIESHNQARTELIHYANKMKEDVGETGLTVHGVLRGNCVRTTLGEELPPGLRKARVLEPTTVTESQRSELKDLAKDLQSCAASVNHWEGLAKHPWRGLENDALDFFQADDLAEELASWKKALESLLVERARFEKAIMWEIEDSVKSIETFVLRALALPSIPDELTDSLIREAATDSGRSLLCNLIRDLEHLNTICNRLDLVFEYRTSENEVELAIVSSVVADARDLGILDVTVGSIEELRQEREHKAQRFNQGQISLNKFASLFGIERPTIADVEAILTATSLLEDIAKESLQLREPPLVLEGSEKVLERGLRKTESLRTMRATITRDFRLLSLPPVPEIKEAANVLLTSGFFKRLFSARYRSARRLYESIAQTGGDQRKRNRGEELAQLARFLEQKRELETDVELTHTAGLAFRGLDTKWQELILVSRWASKVRRDLPNSSDGNGYYSNLLLAGETAKLQRIVELTRKDRPGDLMKVFVGSEYSKEQLVELFCKAAETSAVRFAELAKDLLHLRLIPHVILRDLETVAVAITEMRTIRLRLNAMEAQRVLSGITVPSRAAEVIKAAVNFVDDLASKDIPETVRQEIYSGAARSVISSAKIYANKATDGLIAVANHKRAVNELARLNPQLWVSCVDLDEAPIQQLADRIGLALANQGALQPYLDFLRVESRAKSSSLSAILKHLESAAHPYERLGEVYEFIFFRSCAESILLSDPKLRSHSGATHEQLRKRYQQLDRKLMELRRRAIAHKLTDVSVPLGNSRGRAPEITELSLIRRQIGLQRRHVTLRDLFKRAGQAAQALKPCFMMSPMSVAQFLDPAGMRFDMVVMDEASQIRPEDALGAIVRGNQLVVVGDPKQLPPTTFFEKVDRDNLADDTAEEADIHDLTSQESILDLARGPYQPVRQLRWHYRSQHERLIAFSNHEFYDDTLIVFPSPKGADLEYGVRLISVDGIYEAGLNRMEAEAITDAAQEFMRRFPNRSLGIVAMNKSQQELIQKMLDELFATDVEAESYRLHWENTLDAVFVKNLENVQGDERDVIFISTVYGKDAAGNFFQRLGPINGAHGHRRLNVLFTRAKQQVRLFTSMKANDIRIEPTSRWGVKALKNYLAYAQSGHLESSEITGRQPDSDFERWVMEMLHESGYETVPQLGVAGYYIDLAVRHPEQRGAFILGIECDGAMYHSARSVRDRDRLRQEVLERLKWNIYRIWSTDWFRNPRIEFQKLTNALDNLRRPDS